MNDLKNAIIADGEVTAAEVTQLESAVFADGKATKEEVATLFEINNACAVKDASFAELVAKSVVSCYLADSDSYKELSDAEAAELIALMDTDGKLDSVELLVIEKLYNKAEKMSPAFTTYVKSRIVDAVTEDGVISDEEINAIAALVYGTAEGEEVTREEAELLFTINNKLPKKIFNWNKFFSEAVAEHIVKDGELSHEEAIWLNEQIGADGTVDAAEAALIAKVKASCTTLSPVFKF